MWMLFTAVSSIRAKLGSRRSFGCSCQICAARAGKAKTPGRLESVALDFRAAGGGRLEGKLYGVGVALDGQAHTHHRQCSGGGIRRLAVQRRGTCFKLQDLTQHRVHAVVAGAGIERLRPAPMEAWPSLRLNSMRPVPAERVMRFTAAMGTRSSSGSRQSVAEFCTRVTKSFLRSGLHRRGWRMISVPAALSSAARECAPRAPGSRDRGSAA